MSKVTVELLSKNIGDLMKSAEMKMLMEEYAGKVLARVGEGYEITTHRGQSRVNASVAAVTAKAKRDNYENNTLLKAIGGRFE